MKQNVFNLSVSELKTSQRVPFWNKVITQQSVGFQVKFFGSCQSSKFDFINKQSVFAKQIWNFKKIESFYLCTNGIFCILFAFLRCTIETESFLKISFWVEASNVSDSELNDFQRVKFKNTISKIPRILDWDFYNVPGFELNFFWEIFWEKTMDGKASHFDSYSPGKDNNFVFLFAFLKCKIVAKLFIFQSNFEFKQLQRVRFWITSFENVSFGFKTFRTRHNLNSFFPEKIRSWKILRSKKPRFDSFLTVKTTSSAFCSHFSNEWLLRQFSKKIPYSRFGKFYFLASQTLKWNFFQMFWFRIKTFTTLGILYQTFTMSQAQIFFQKETDFGSQSYFVLFYPGKTDYKFILFAFLKRTIVTKNIFCKETLN